MEIDPTRRTMDRIGETTYIPYLNIRQSDAAVLVGFPLLAFLGGAVLWNPLAIPAGLCGLCLGVALVKAAPDHLTATGWVRDVASHYLQQPRVHLHTPADSDQEATEGGLAEYVPFTPDERTQDLTGLERAWAGAGAVQRADDAAMEAWIEIHPCNRDFAMSDDWAAVQQTARQFANDELDYPITFHVTTRPFPADQMVAQLEQRQQDPDVQANPIFQELIGEYRAQRPEHLADVSQIHYYLGVEVRQIDVYDRYEGDHTPMERLARLPVVGPLVFERFVTRRKDLSEEELREQMVEKLDTRIRQLETHFVDQINGWDARRLSTLELFLLNMAFWNGTHHADEVAVPDEVLRSAPVAASSARDDAAIVQEASE